MWTSEGQGERKTYEPHTPGAYAAVCADVFEKVFPNPFFGQKDKFTGEVDNRKDVTKVCIAFLTSETIDIEGEQKPRYTSFWAAKSWHEKSKLRGFVSKWDTKLGQSDKIDPESLIGKTAMVSVENYTRRDGTIGHGVTVAMPCPKGMLADVPSLDGFTRQKDTGPRGDAPVAEQARPQPQRTDSAFPETDPPF
jgi:hypothetical protein